MDSDLPQFRKVKRRYAASIIHSALSGPSGAALLQLIEYEDRHFRAIFDRSYFQKAAGNTTPSKSQWNSLKKRLKRRDRSIFVFRQYGRVDCGAHGKRLPASDCFYIDIGFLSQ